MFRTCFVYNFVFAQPHHFTIIFPCFVLLVVISQLQVFLPNYAFSFFTRLFFSIVFSL
jgi:hypothetical protein